MGNVSADKNLNYLQTVFFTIKKKTNDILSPYNNMSFVNDPSVDIEVVAKNCGIIDILYVDPKDLKDPKEPKEIDNKHAILVSTPDGPVIKVNKKDTVAEQRFSIAHELEHYLKDKANTSDHVKRLSDILSFRGKKGFPKEIKLAARINPKGLRKLVFFILTRKFSNGIAENVSKYLGKSVSSWKASSILMIVISASVAKETGKEIYKKAINKLYNEEMADYFAANLLVPTERFLLWADKPDGKIAKAFKVPKSCIKKRRKEIFHENEFMKLNNLSFGGEIKG